MGMEYQLRKMTLDSTSYIALLKDDYDSIKSAKTVLIEALHIEEKFDIIIENYLELESELLKSSTRSIVQDNTTYDSFQILINVFNRRIINLLTACRLYLDHLKHHINNITKINSNLDCDIKTLTHDEYDQYLGYRVMEALRNYVQHRGYPIHKVTLNSAWDDDFQQLKSNTIIKIEPKKLKTDGKFKKCILNEILPLGDSLSLMPYVKDYISSLSRINLTVRDKLRQTVFDKENIILASIQKYWEQFPAEKSPTGISAVSILNDQKVNEEIPLFSDFIEYRKKFEQKNMNLDSLPKRIVTS